jgi:hypothetical protein
MSVFIVDLIPILMLLVHNLFVKLAIVCLQISYQYLFFTAATFKRWSCELNKEIF